MNHSKLFFRIKKFGRTISLSFINLMFTMSGLSISFMFIQKTSYATDFYPRLQREYISEIENLYQSLDLTPVLSANYLISQLPSNRSFDEVSASTFKAALQLSLIHCTNVFNREISGEIPLFWMSEFSEEDRNLLIGELSQMEKITRPTHPVHERFRKWLKMSSLNAFKRAFNLDEITQIETEIYFTLETGSFDPLLTGAMKQNILPFTLGCVSILASPEVLFFNGEKS